MPRRKLLNNFYNRRLAAENETPEEPRKSPARTVPPGIKMVTLRMTVEQKDAMDRIAVLSGTSRQHEISTAVDEYIRTYDPNIPHKQFTLGAPDEDDEVGDRIDSLLAKLDNKFH